MATISFRVSEEEKNLIFDYAKKNYKTMSEFLLETILEKIEDREDYLLGEARMIDKENSKVIGDLKSVAENFGINYEEL